MYLNNLPWPTLAQEHYEYGVHEDFTVCSSQENKLEKGPALKLKGASNLSQTIKSLLSHYFKYFSIKLAIMEGPSSQLLFFRTDVDFRANFWTNFFAPIFGVQFLIF